MPVGKFELPCGTKLSWDRIFANFSSIRENEISWKQTRTKKNSAKNNITLFIYITEFNKIGCKQCNENNLPYFLYNNFVTFKYRTCT